MTIIFEQQPPSTLKFGDVQENQFFVDTNGYLCQKANSSSYHTIADNNGELYSTYVDLACAYDKVKRILPKVTKIEF
jgi:hypothetical protein